MVGVGNKGSIHKGTWVLHIQCKHPGMSLFRTTTPRLYHITAFSPHHHILNRHFASKMSPIPIVVFGRKAEIAQKVREDMLPEFDGKITLLRSKSPLTLPSHTHLPYTLFRRAGPPAHSLDTSSQPTIFVVQPGLPELCFQAICNCSRRRIRRCSFRGD
jgi:hypothetical protein